MAKRATWRRSTTQSQTHPGNHRTGNQEGPTRMSRSTAKRAQPADLAVTRHGQTTLAPSPRDGRRSTPHDRQAMAHLRKESHTDVHQCTLSCAVASRPKKDKAPAALLDVQRQAPVQQRRKATPQATRDRTRKAAPDVAPPPQHACAVAHHQRRPAPWTGDSFDAHVAPAPTGPR